MAGTVKPKACPFCNGVGLSYTSGSRYDPKGATERRGALYQPTLSISCLCKVSMTRDVPFTDAHGTASYNIINEAWNERGGMQPLIDAAKRLKAAVGDVKMYQPVGNMTELHEAYDVMRDRLSEIEDGNPVGELVEAAKEFVRRVEAGEILSKKSYAAFKKALACMEEES